MVLIKIFLVFWLWWKILVKKHFFYISDFTWIMRLSGASGILFGLIISKWCFITNNNSKKSQRHKLSFKKEPTIALPLTLLLAAISAPAVSGTIYISKSELIILSHFYTKFDIKVSGSVEIATSSFLSSSIQATTPATISTSTFAPPAVSSTWHIFTSDVIIFIGWFLFNNFYQIQDMHIVQLHHLVHLVFQ